MGSVQRWTLVPAPWKGALDALSSTAEPPRVTTLGENWASAPDLLAAPTPQILCVAQRDRSANNRGIEKQFINLFAAV